MLKKINSFQHRSGNFAQKSASKLSNCIQDAKIKNKPTHFEIILKLKHESPRGI